MGNLIVAQSGGPTAVINASLAGIIREATKHGMGVFGAVHGIEGVLGGNFYNLTERFDSEEKLEALAHTPAAFLGTCRHRLPAGDESTYQRIFDNFAEKQADCFLYIGGNDSMDTVDKLSKFGAKIDSPIRVVGIPKTIDNDLAVTDHTPGFGSAAKYVAASMREIILDSRVYDIDTLTIVEIMGRNAGWLTAASALARTFDGDAPHFIYLPERAFDVEKFLSDLKKAIEKHRNVIVALSEGVKTSNGKYLCEYLNEDSQKDAFGHIQLTGAAASLAEIVKKRIKVKVRAIELSLLQRSAGHLQSAVDVREAGEIGASGVRAAMEGKTGVMMMFKRVSDSPYNVEITAAEVKDIANAEKKVPSEWILESDISPELVKYIKPLIEGEAGPKFAGGLPEYVSREA